MLEPGSTIKDVCTSWEDMERDKTYLRSISTGKIILDRLTTQPSYTPKTDQDPKTDQEIYTTVYFLNV